MKTEKIYTDTKYVKRHFCNTLDKPYLNKDDKKFLLHSFEILENYINKISQYSLLETTWGEEKK
tara:strand:- start:321 stop:512 length:192 start_codon:yes stop_codon:yes gene_type:complete